MSEIDVQLSTEKKEVNVRITVDAEEFESTNELLRSVLMWFDGEVVELKDDGFGRLIPDESTRVTRADIRKSWPKLPPEVKQCKTDSVQFTPDPDPVTNTLNKLDAQMDAIEALQTQHPDLYRDYRDHVMRAGVEMHNNIENLRNLGRTRGMAIEQRDRLLNVTRRLLAEVFTDDPV